MKRPNPSNWLKRSNRFVPFEFFSADPDDYKKYIDSEDCPPPMLAAAWEDVKSKMADIKNNFLDIVSSGNLDGRCNSIGNIIDSIIKNPNTPEDITFEMTEINWQAFKFRCRMVNWDRTLYQLTYKNSYENLVKLFENSMNKLSYDEKSKKSNFTAYVHDSIYALNTMRSIMNRAVLSTTIAEGMIGDSEVFFQYIKNNQLKIIKSFENFTGKTFLSSDREILNELHQTALLGAGEDYSSNAFFSQIWAIISMMQGETTGKIGYNLFDIGSETTRKSFDLTKKMSSAGFVPNTGNPVMKMYRIRLMNVRHKLGMAIGPIDD